MQGQASWAKIGGIFFDALQYWRGLRIWSKNRVFFGWSKFVNACVERDKKNFGFLDFWFQVYAQMIET